MRTYQRLVIARGNANLGTTNPAYPHNFLIANSATNVLKIGSTGTRYNSLPEIGKTPQTFVPPANIETESTNVEQPQELVWPPKKKTTKRKKAADPIVLQADDSDEQSS